MLSRLACRCAKSQGFGSWQLLRSSAHNNLSGLPKFQWRFKQSGPGAPGGGGGPGAKDPLQSRMKFKAGKIEAPKSKQDPLAWLSTENGQKFVIVTTVAGTVAAIAAYRLPHTFLLDSMRDVLQEYNAGHPTQVSREVEHLVRQAILDVGLTAEEMRRLRLMVGYPFEAGTYGNLPSAAGAIVHYPSFFHNATPEAVSTSNLRGGSAALSSSGGKETADLKNALCLSDAAKRFVVARELNWAKKSTFEFNSFSAGACTLIAYFTSRGLRKLLRNPARAVRYPMYAMVALLSGVLHLVMKDEVNDKRSKECDQAACRLGKAYAEGGVEYYDKILKRNIALRTLLSGDQGKKMFTLKGDLFPGLIRKKIRPITERKRTCEEELNALNVSAQNDAVNS